MWWLKSGRLVEYPQVIPMWGLKGQVVPPGSGGPGFPTAPDYYFVAERQGTLRPPRREVGLALFGVRRYLTRLTRSWYLI